MNARKCRRWSSKTPILDIWATYIFGPIKEAEAQFRSGLLIDCREY